MTRSSLPPGIVVAVDVVIFTVDEAGLQVVLTKRPIEPFAGSWSLPGGFVQQGETLEATAERILRDKAGVKGVFLEQLYTFDTPKRDPRGQILSVAHLALVDRARLASLADDTILAEVDVTWEGERGGPATARTPEGARIKRLAFDHAEILGTAVKRIRGKLNYAPIGFQLLPKAFSLRELQEVHEAILGRQVNKHSFRRRMLESGSIEPTGEREEGVGYRPAQKFRFVERSAI